MLNGAVDGVMTALLEKGRNDNNSSLVTVSEKKERKKEICVFVCIAIKC